MSGAFRLPLRAIILGLVLFGLIGCATPQEETTLPSVTDADGQFKLGNFLQALRQSPEMRPTGMAICVVALEKDTGSQTFHPFLASFFDVPLESASNAFCEALTEAVFSDALSDADLVAIDAPFDSNSYGAVGKLLRQLLISHERAGTQMVSNEPAQR